MLSCDRPESVRDARSTEREGKSSSQLMSCSLGFCSVSSAAILVVQVRVDGARRVVLRVVLVVGARHPHPVRVPRQVVLGDPSATALRAAAVKVPRDRVGVLLALALPSGLHPLDGVALRLEANAAGVLDDDHHRQRPDDQEGRDHPEGELLEPSPVRGEVLSEVAPVDRVEDARRQNMPVLPVVAVVVDGLVQGVPWLLRRSVNGAARSVSGGHTLVQLNHDTDTARGSQHYDVVC